MVGYGKCHGGRMFKSESQVAEVEVELGITPSRIQISFPLLCTVLPGATYWAHALSERLDHLVLLGPCLSPARRSCFL